MQEDRGFLKFVKEMRHDAVSSIENTQLGARFPAVKELSIVVVEGTFASSIQNLGLINQVRDIMEARGEDAGVINKVMGLIERRK